ncbi:transmembrane protein 154 [Aulostomus maculatus]
MSASWPGNMRGPQGKTPLLLLLLLVTTLAGTVFCQDYGDESDTETHEEEAGEEATAEDEPEVIESLETTSSIPDISPTSNPINILVTVEEPITDVGSGAGAEDPTSLDPTATPSGETVLTPTIILIPVVLVVLIIAMIVFGICIKRKWDTDARNQDSRKEDPYLDGSSTEKVPMPMFEEDVPSVLELEMDELDQWMKKDG